MKVKQPKTLPNCAVCRLRKTIENPFFGNYWKRRPSPMQYSLAPRHVLNDYIQVSLFHLLPLSELFQLAFFSLASIQLSSIHFSILSTVCCLSFNIFFCICFQITVIFYMRHYFTSLSSLLPLLSATSSQLFLSHCFLSILYFSLFPSSIFPISFLYSLNSLIYHFSLFSIFSTVTSF